MTSPAEKNAAAELRDMPAATWPAVSTGADGHLAYAFTRGLETGTVLGAKDRELAVSEAASRGYARGKASSQPATGLKLLYWACGLITGAWVATLAYRRSREDGDDDMPSMWGELGEPGDGSDSGG